MPRKFLRRAADVFDWRTGVVTIVLLILVLTGYLIVAAVQQAHSAMTAAHDATVSATKRAAAASHRIDLLNRQIAGLQREIAAGHDERGQLATAVAALTEQVRQLGGRPIVIITPSPVSSPQPTRTPRPTSSPRPRPTPSPTCTRLPVTGTCRPAR